MVVAADVEAELVALMLRWLLLLLLLVDDRLLFDALELLFDGALFGCM